MKTKSKSEAKQYLVIVQPCRINPEPEAYSLYSNDPLAAIYEAFPYLRDPCFNVHVDYTRPKVARITVDDTIVVDSFLNDFQKKGSAK